MLTYLSRFPGPPSLSCSIREYVQISGDGATAKSLAPRSGAVFSLNLEGSFRVDGQLAPAASVAGVREHPARFVPESPTTDRLLVRFRPCGLRGFAKVSAASLRNRSVQAEEVFPADLVKELLVSLSRSHDFEQRATLLDSFFLELLMPPDPAQPDIEILADRLCNGHFVSLGSLLRGRSGSLRQTERDFVRLVGLSPRAFARLARFERAKNAVLANEDKPLTQVGLEAGYYDQSHFNREFKSLSLMPPGSYRFCASPEAGS